LFESARRVAANPAAPEPDRLAALPLLARDSATLDSDLDLLGTLLGPVNSPPVQNAALAALGRARVPHAAAIQVAAWRYGGPALRARLLDQILTRQEWIGVLLTAVEKGEIPAGALGAPRQQKLLRHPQSAIRDRAAKLFATAGADRQAVLQRYSAVGTLHGDSVRGRDLFRKTCIVCHRFQGEGSELGPDLESVAFKPADYLVTAIMDPNQSFEERYIGYTATTKNDQEFSGLVANESANSITLRLPGGSEIGILRADLKELAGSGRSLMPEGFESAFDPQALADVIAWLRAGASPKIFPGNSPAVIHPNSDGALSLTAAHCKIFGETLAFEDQYSNLGYWRSANDQAVWSVDLPQAGDYEVWLDWALPEDAPRNGWRLETSAAPLVQKTLPTGSWDIYHQAKIGTVTLPSGPQTILVRSDGPITGDLFDLRSIRLVPVKR